MESSEADEANIQDSALHTPEGESDQLIEKADAADDHHTDQSREVSKTAEPFTIQDSPVETNSCDESSSSSSSSLPTATMTTSSTTITEPNDKSLEKVESTSNCESVQQSEPLEAVPNSDDVSPDSTPDSSTDQSRSLENVVTMETTAEEIRDEPMEEN